jgi:CO/xanthine dehydrogenase FAD-binding subunit
VDVLAPQSLSEALDHLESHPDAVLLAGGTDLMVDLNFDRLRPRTIVDLGSVTELTDWEADDGMLRLGAGVTFSRVIDEIAGQLPGLAIASRTVGSPQIRNRGTLGGNLGTASPAGDALPPLVAADAEVELASAAGTRRLPIADFILGPRSTGRAPNEIIAAVRVRPARGAQQFAKVGTRNAMVIAVCSVAIDISPELRYVGVCLGSSGPVPIRAVEAERFLEGVIDESGLWDGSDALPPSAVDRFADLVAGAAQPIDDVRGTAAYRRHALGVLAGRALGWAWDEVTACA